MDYQALKTELDGSHPVTGTYNVDSALAAGELNAVNVSSIKATMSGKELMDLTDPTEYLALTDSEKAQWLALTGHDIVNTEVGGMGQVIGTDIFTAGTTTSNIGTARQITISRAVDLGFGFVTPGDVEYARTL